MQVGGQHASTFAGWMPDRYPKGLVLQVLESSSDGTLTHPALLKDRVTSPAGTTIAGAPLHSTHHSLQSERIAPSGLGSHTQLYD